MEPAFKSSRKVPAKVVNVGLIGLGVVGSGAAGILLQSDPPLSVKTGIEIRLKKIATLPPVNPFKLPIPEDMITQDAMEIIADPDIDIIVETVGGIEPARTYILEALKRGKQVVSANKKLLAEYMAELFNAAHENESAIGFEASSGGGVPCVLALRDGLIANRIDTVLGIVNGTSNYILTRMLKDDMPFETALREAQSRGYAEADPSLDVEGGDSAHKLALLGSLAFNQMIESKRIPTEGITGITLNDVRYAQELGYEIKLLAVGKRLAEGLDLRVHPTLVPSGHPLAAVEGVFNAIYIIGDAVGEQMFYGKGAGRMPTGSAIVADIIDCARGTARQSFSRMSFFMNSESIPVLSSGEIETSYFIRVHVLDQWGVIGQIGTIMGEHKISLRSVMQHDTEVVLAGGEKAVPVILLTHKTREHRVSKALEIIKALPSVYGEPKYLRVEGEKWGS